MLSEFDKRPGGGGGGWGSGGWGGGGGGGGDGGGDMGGDGRSWKSKLQTLGALGVFMAGISQILHQVCFSAPLQLSSETVSEF